jgi:murein hydrolase activator
MRRALKTATLLVILLAGSVLAQRSSDIQGQRKDLEKIQRDVKKSRDRLDSLKREEARITKELSERDEKLESQKKLISRLNTDLTQLRNSIGETQDGLNARQDALEQSRRRFLGNLRQLYFSGSRSAEDLVASPLDELDAAVRVTYLTSLVNFESGSVVAASEQLGKSLSQLEQLTGQRAQIASLKRKREVSFALDQSRKEKQERSLDKLRKAKRDEADRITTLQHAAAEMEKIIARIEQESKKAPAPTRKQPEGGGSGVAFASLKGHLTAPFKGNIAVAYGSSVDAVTHLKSFSPGITIKGRPGGRVTAIADGSVVYSGNLRGYGNFVIVNHDNLYYSTYAGLGTVAVSEGDMVSGGSVVGTAEESGQIKFELRKGREPVDPLEWINIDAF